jgi:hypothetical protein
VGGRFSSNQLAEHLLPGMYHFTTGLPHGKIHGVSAFVVGVQLSLKGANLLDQLFAKAITALLVQARIRIGAGHRLEF